MDTITTIKPPANVTAIAKFFGLKGTAAVQAMRGLSAEDKQALGDGIRDGSLTY